MVYYCLFKKHFPYGPPAGRKARQIAEQLGKHDFKGSNGWLDKWKKKYNIKWLKINGESGDVQGETISSWKECLPEIIQGYDRDNIWNMNETGVFWKALPDRGFGQKGQQCKGGKKSKQRITHQIHTWKEWTSIVANGWYLLTFWIYCVGTKLLEMVTTCIRNLFWIRHINIRSGSSKSINQVYEQTEKNIDTGNQQL